jgi:hypothetical protein
MQTYGGSGCIDPHTDLGTSWWCGQLHTPATLPWEKEHIPIEPVWTTWRREHFRLYQDSNSDPSAIQSIASCPNWLSSPGSLFRGTKRLLCSPHKESPTFHQKCRIENSMVWVRKRTIPTEWPPLVGEVIANFCGYRVPRGQRDRSLRPYSVF